MATPKKVPLPAQANAATATQQQQQTAPPQNGATATKTIPDVVPQGVDAKVRTQIEYTIDKDSKKPQQQRLQTPATPISSGNPILDFLDQLEDGEDVYILLKRLPDNISGVKYNRPCPAAEMFPLMPINRASFIKDIQEMNGNSGGRFSGIITDENMSDIGYEPLATVVIPNPLTTVAAKTAGTFEEMILKHIQDSEKRTQEMLAKLTEPKESEFDKMSKMMIMKQFEKMMNGEGNASGVSGLPQEQQTMLAILGNPAMTKAVTNRMSESISAMFATPEKAEDTINKATSWVERGFNIIENNPQIQDNLMAFGNKLVDLVGFGVAKFASRGTKQQRPPRPNGQRPPQQQQQRTAAPPPVQNPAPPIDDNAIDVEFTEVVETNDVVPEFVELTPEQEAEEAAIIASPFFQDALKYIDSDTPLVLDNPFMQQGELLTGVAKMKFKLAIATLKELEFDAALDWIYDNLPLIEDFTTEEIMMNETTSLGQYRIVRLMEFHALLKDYNVE